MFDTSVFNGLHSLIGNTPMLEIDFLYKRKKCRIFAKAENLNLTGSIKDRMAFHILKKAYERGTLNPGDMIVEATSGNTGISFSSLGRALGHPVTIYMPNWMSNERINLIHSMGAAIHLVSKDEGGFLGSIKMAEDLAERRGNVFLPNQFSNEDNVEAHELSTGPEIWWQLRTRSLTLDAFVAGVGTGGTIMGVGKYLREQNSNIKLHPLEPSNSPTLTTGYKVGKHRIQGISDEFIPSIVKLDRLNEVIAVDDGDSIIMAQKLAQELGLGVGISSGANFLGALKLLESMGENAVIATIFSDDNKKYLSTDLLREENIKPDFLSKDVKLLSYKAYKRVCNTCCNPDLCLDATFPVNIENSYSQLHDCAKRSICRG